MQTGESRLLHLAYRHPPREPPVDLFPDSTAPCPEQIIRAQCRELIPPRRERSIERLGPLDMVNRQHPRQGDGTEGLDRQHTDRPALPLLKLPSSTGESAATTPLRSERSIDLTTSLVKETLKLTIVNNQSTTL